MDNAIFETVQITLTKTVKLRTEVVFLMITGMVDEIYI